MTLKFWSVEELPGIKQHLGILESCNPGEAFLSVSEQGNICNVNMSERFECLECQESLYGQKYILKEESMFCICCYEARFSHKCEVCQLLIGCTSKVTRQPAEQNRNQTHPELTADPGSAGSVLQGAPLAQRLLPVQQLQPLSGGAAVRHQGQPADVCGVLQQPVLSQVHRLPEDHHAR